MWGGRVDLVDGIVGLRRGGSAEGERDREGVGDRERLARMKGRLWLGTQAQGSPYEQPLRRGG